MKGRIDNLKKKGIISDEGVIDPYQLCKYAEELFGKSYLKKHNVILDDDRKNRKIDKFYCNFDYVLDNNGGLQSVVNTLHNIIETECKMR